MVAHKFSTICVGQFLRRELYLRLNSAKSSSRGQMSRAFLTLSAHSQGAVWMNCETERDRISQVVAGGCVTLMKKKKKATIKKEGEIQTNEIASSIKCAHASRAYRV